MKMKLFTWVLFALCGTFLLAACNKDDDGGSDPSSAIAGRYFGKLYSSGSVVQDRCFVQIERYSSTDVKLTLESDNYNPGSCIMQITSSGNGKYELGSSSYAVTATVQGTILNFYYTAGDYAYTFTGSKQ